MKFITSSFAIATLFAAIQCSSAGKLSPSPVPGGVSSHPDTRCNSHLAVPLLRAYSPAATDHFYTTNAAEMYNAVSKLGYNAEGTTGLVFRKSEPQTVPFYRMYNSRIMDHFYTTNAAEKDNAISNLGYTYEGIAGYIYPHSLCGALPLYRLYSIRASDHFYTMSAAERDNASGYLGYTQEGIAGYIFPA